MHAMNATSFKFYSLYVSPTEKIDHVKKVHKLGVQLGHRRQENVYALVLPSFEKNLAQ